MSPTFAALWLAKARFWIISNPARSLAVKDGVVALFEPYCREHINLSKTWRPT
jgi:hypothetical protein